MEQLVELQTDAYMFGGGPTDHRTFTELYDGTSWASQPNMANVLRNALVQDQVYKAVV